MQFAELAELLAEELLIDPALVQPESLLVSGLGLHPMDLVQLVERLEERLGTPLTGLDLHAVETVGELFRELLGGASDSSGIAPTRRHRDTPLQPHEVALREWLPTDPHADVDTLVGVLSRQGAIHPEREALCFDDSRVTYRELARSAAQVASALRRHGVGRGDVVLLVIPHRPEFFAVFFGIQLLRATAVPLPATPLPERMAAIARHCGAKALVSQRPLARPVLRRLEAALGQEESGHDAPDMMLLTARALTHQPVESTRPLPRSEPGDLAMLQYTSGTTGDPRAVMLTQGALLANVRQLIPTARLTDSDCVVSWLPLSHDLGLIAMALVPLYLGARFVCLPRRLDPHAWLGAIEAFGATVTAAPDFAWRYLLRFGGKLDRFDVSSLRIGVVAGEPVRAATLQRVEAALGLPGVLRPAYGLAELTVGVCMVPPDVPTTVDAQGRVALGRAFAGVELELRDADDHRVSAGVPGEVCVRSPAQTLGYFRNPARTAELFTADGWVRTGDVGVLGDDGQLTLLGRAKDVMIVAGRLLWPGELEQAVEAAADVEACAALGLDLGGDAGEQVHLFVETPVFGGYRRDQQALMRHLREWVQERLDVRVTRVHLMPPGRLPRTETGKLSRWTLRQQVAAAAERAVSQGSPD